jgi:hypothetical protein
MTTLLSHIALASLGAALLCACGGSTGERAASSSQTILIAGTDGTAPCNTEGNVTDIDFCDFSDGSDSRGTAGPGGGGDTPPDPGGFTGDGECVQAPGDPAIYLVMDGGFLRHIPNAATFNNLFRSWTVVQGWPPNAQVNKPLATGAFLARAADSPDVYLVNGSVKRHILSPAVMGQYNFSWDAIRVLSNADLAKIPTGKPIDSH